MSWASEVGRQVERWYLEGGLRNGGSTEQVIGQKPRHETAQEDQ